MLIIITKFDITKLPCLDTNMLHNFVEMLQNLLMCVIIHKEIVTNYSLNFIVVDADMGGKRGLELLKYRQKVK